MRAIAITFLICVILIDGALAQGNGITQEKSLVEQNTLSGSSLWVTAYYPEFGDANPTPAEIDWSAFTHLIIFTTEATQRAPYFFRELPGTSDSANFDGGYTRAIPWRKAIVDSAHTHGVKVLMCLGGEVGSNQANFSYMLADPSRRTAYINYVIGFARDRRNMDGVDVDHEFTSSGEGANLVAFFTELRTKWPAAVITSAVPIWSSPAYYNNASFYNGTTVDQLNIMQYGQDDGSTISGYTSPLFQPRKAYPNYNGGSWFNGNSGSGPSSYSYGQGPYDGWASKGINKNKIGVLIPFQVASKSGITAPGQSKSGAMAFDNYSNVVAALKAGAVEHWDDEAKVPWLTYNNTFYSYENAASLKAKIDTVRNGGFGGIGIWELFRGYARNTSPPDLLLQATKQFVFGGNPQPPDTLNPVVSLTSPTNGATVSGTVTLTATANDNVGVTRVEFAVNGTTVATDVSVPYSYLWNTVGLAGNKVLSAKAFDAAGNAGQSNLIIVSIAPPPDTVKPSILLTSPTDGQNVSGAVMLSATASDNVGVVRVEFFVDGALIDSVLDVPYSTSWNATGLSGSHQITAKSYDSQGNVGLSNAVDVIITPPQPPDPVDTIPPSVSISSPSAGATISGTVTFTGTATDNMKLAMVKLQLDGVDAGSVGTSSPFSLRLTTTKYSNGSHSVSATATDSMGLSRTTSILVNISNALKRVKRKRRAGSLNPMEFILEQNYPNPFNPSTTIEYDIPERAVISLKVYNMLGVEVAQLYQGEQNPGFQTAVWDAAEVPAGVYIARLLASNSEGMIVYSQTKKMLLIK